MAVSEPRPRGSGPDELRLGKIPVLLLHGGGLSFEQAVILREAGNMKSPMSVDEKRALYHYLCDPETGIVLAHDLVSREPDIDRHLLHLIEAAGEHITELRRQLSSEVAREIFCDGEAEEQ